MNWDEEVGPAREEMDRRHAAREAALSVSRSVIQTCSKCIKHVHRKQIAEAQGLLQHAMDLLNQGRAAAAGQPEILYAGYLQDAEKEFVEAAGCLALAEGRSLPARTELGVSVVAYLNGMGECASEMRRTVLDVMREGNMAEAERLLRAMETIYDDLTTFDYPDGVTGGLRRTCDALRAVIERTRSDLTLTSVQNQLLRELQSHPTPKN